MLSEETIFAKYDTRPFNSVYDLDYIGQNFVSITTLHYGMTFKIREGLSSGNDLGLKFDANVGWELGQTAVAAIGKMQVLSKSQYKKCFGGHLSRWSDKDNDWMQIIEVT